MVYQRLVLDFSGTIVDDRARVHQTMNDVLRFYDQPEIDFSTWKSHISLDFKVLWRGLGVSAPINEIVAKYQEYYPHNQPCTLIPGNRKALARLSRKIGRAQMSILSGCKQNELEADLSELESDEFFGIIIGDMHNKERGLNLFKEKILYIGDMEQDAAAANSLGVDFAAVDNEYAYHTREVLARHNPKYIIKQLGELVGILENGR